MTGEETSALESLLAKLVRGDAVAAARVFEQYEPYLRKVVRRLLPDRLRCKFDSLDIVQSAWGDLLNGFRKAGWRFANANQLQAFLVKVTRNRFLDRVRQHNLVLAHEQPAHDNSLDRIVCRSEPSPSQHAEANELWQRMLQCCPVDYRPILLLRRRGLTPNEIADRTGMHAGSVRRILRQVAGRVASSETELQQR